jgi:CheY-like chemotaxis protein
MASTPTELAGLTILVVEDNFLVAESVRELLEEGGCHVVGPIARVGQAMRRARETELDGAILDINLAGEFCFPLAHQLREAGVPFIFLTGYGEVSLIPPELRDIPRLGKPFDGADVVRAAAQRFARSDDQGAPRSSNGAGAPSSNS